jgi:hypothetical protein
MMNKYKPNQGEYPVFYKGYIDVLEDAPLITTLESEKASALSVLKSIPQDKSDYQYAEGKWTVKQVIIHIIDTEVIFGYRALAIARGEKQSLPGFDQDEYMSYVDPEKTTLKALIDLFDHLRSTNIALLKMLRKEDMKRIGIASGYEIQPKTIGYFIAGHCKYHINILQERYGI